MEIEKILTYGATAVAGVALVLGIVSNVNVSSVKESLRFDTSINVPIAGTEEELAAAATAETQNETETAAPEDAAGEDAVDDKASEEPVYGMHVVSHNGMLRLVDSWLRVPMLDSESDTEDLYVYLGGTNTVKYNSESDYLVVNEKAIIKTIKASDVSFDGISEFTNEDATPILIGERRVNDTSAIAVVYTLEGSKTATEEDVAVVQNLLNTARSDVKVSDFTLFGAKANPDWLEDMVMTSKALELIKGESKVYVSPYTGTFAEGTTNTLPAGDGVSLTYSDNITDTSTGYRPYIYEFNSDQGGKVSKSSSETSTLRVKFLAQKNGVIKEIFEN